MTIDPPTLPQAQLWQAVRQRSAAALASGALLGIETEESLITDRGVTFIVRVARNLRRKAAERANAPDRNPFLPPEPALTVAPVAPRHVAVLNKFNVVSHHLLLVTREFEHQETLLDAGDFIALWACMRPTDDLAFYNGGATAGASQQHKHLQLVPLPLGRTGPALPMEALIARARPAAGVSMLPELPFRHAFCRLDASDAAAAPELLHRRYRELLAACGIRALPQAGRLWQSAPYNLLLTSRWMLVVPRVHEHARGISINALGFAGSLFVLDAAALQHVHAAGPFDLLRTAVGD